MNKTYFWLKLEQDFFTSKEIKKMRRLPDGEKFILVYLRLMLASVSSGGVLTYDGIEDDFAAEMALALDEDEDCVRAVLDFLLERGMMTADGDEYQLRDVSEMLGKEGADASRMRKSRAKKRPAPLPDDDAASVNTSEHCSNTSEHCSNVVQKCSAEKEIEIELEIESEKESESEESERTRTPAHAQEKRGRYRNVDLTDEEVGLLREEFPDDWEQRIERLSEYMAASGRTYSSHLAVIRTWAKQDSDAKKSPARPAASSRSFPDRSFPDGGSFDTDEMYAAALRRSYGDLMDDCSPDTG